MILIIQKSTFQSTPPVKAATQVTFENFTEGAISIHAAREGGDKSLDGSGVNAYISIHAAREGGD